MPVRRVVLAKHGCNTLAKRDGRLDEMQQPFVVKGEVIHPQREAAQNAWSSGLCDCTGDWCSLFTVWCCTPVTTAQLFTRCVT